MRRCVILILGLLVMNGLFSTVNFTENSSGIILEYQRLGDQEEQVQLKQILAIPALEVEARIISGTASEYSATGEYLGERDVKNEDMLEINSFVMRELYAHEVVIKLEENLGDRKTVIQDLRVELINRQPVAGIEKISSVFRPVYQAMVDNFAQSYLYHLPAYPPGMLIITPTSAASLLENFVEWKNALGITTAMATLDQTGNTSTSIKNYIQAIYDDQSATPPDYLLLIGDVNGAYAMPSFYYSAENNVSDHPYTMLAGDDYLPEMIVGRLTVDTQFELMTVVNKILFYEKNPYLDDPSWLTRALLVAGNYASTPPIPTTPTAVSQWLHEKMTDFGYTQVDEVFYPPTYPGTSAIINSINNGVGFVSYRGWGDANGWHYPNFKREDVQNLNNGLLLPVVTSIVCNTADFANSVDPCFGELLLNIGTPTTPKGAVAVVGPSDLHTSTMFNNAIFSGFYNSVLTEGIRSFGVAVLRGKQELYRNYPLIQAPGEYVEFYFHVYNILGDPSLSMWTGVPLNISLAAEIPAEISLGTNYLDVQVNDLEGGIVTAVKEGEFFEIATIENGVGTLFLAPETTGNFTVTVSKPDYLHLERTVQVIQNAVDIGLDNYSLNNDLLSGASLELTATLKNYGTASSAAFQAQLVTDNSYVEITDDLADFPALAADGAADGLFQFNLLPDCPHGETIEFSLMLAGYGQAKLHLQANSLQLAITDFAVDDADAILDPGDEAGIIITMANWGSVDAAGLQAEITSLCDAVQVLTPVVELGDLEAGEEIQATFTAQVAADCFNGRTASFRFDLQDDNLRTATAYLTMTIGEVDTTDPTPGTDLKYYVYDSFDVDYAEAPVYEWIEIDPQLGGTGQVIYMCDDESVSLELPFTFRYYDTDYDSITACSNGWISFETTWEINFFNWTIPAPLGPYAMLAPYWDDLIGELYMVGDSTFHHDMRICHYHDAAAQRFIVQWSDCYNNYDDESLEKFQIVLPDPQYYSAEDGNGIIQFNYHTVNNPDVRNNYATVGIESPDQENGVLYTSSSTYPPSATPLQDGLSIKFTTNPPDAYTGSQESEFQPDLVDLLPNYPNPFNPETTIQFSLMAESTVQLVIYNLKGQAVRILQTGVLPAGWHQFVWDGTDDNDNILSSGIYFYRLDTGEGQAQVRKCILMK